LHDVDDVIEGENSFHAILGVDNRKCEEIVLREKPRHGFLIQVLGNGDHAVDGVMTSRTCFSGEAANSSRMETTPSSLCAGVENVRVRQGFESLSCLPSQVENRLVGGHVRSHSREAGAHEPTGLIFA
jgi:hypothetical protein